MTTQNNSRILFYTDALNKRAENLKLQISAIFQVSHIFFVTKEVIQKGQNMKLVPNDQRLLIVTIVTCTGFIQCPEETY